MVALAATEHSHQPPPKSLVGLRAGTTPKPSPFPILPLHGPFFAGWSVSGVAGAVRHHPLPLVFAFLLLVFMGVEYTIPMVASASPPLDLGFVVTKPLHAALAAAPALNTALAALNTVSYCPIDDCSPYSTRFLRDRIRANTHWPIYTRSSMNTRLNTCL